MTNTSSSTMPALDVNTYFMRLGMSGPLPPTAETLRRLHRSHLEQVPFENLDIHLGRPIVLDKAQLFDKVVRQRRGGFCYELNGLFAELLRTLGFEVTLLSARVADQDGVFSPEFDHLTLLVNTGEMWLADVGFGDAFLEPLHLVPGLVQKEDGKEFQLDQDGDAWTFLERSTGASWKVQYRFTLTPRTLADFTQRCLYHQMSPESHFTRNTLITILTPSGRVTLRGDRLITTADGERKERTVRFEERSALLREHFGMGVSIVPDKG